MEDRGFAALLAQLAVAHEREVQGLRAELAGARSALAHVQPAPEAPEGQHPPAEESHEVWESSSSPVGVHCPPDPPPQLPVTPMDPAAFTPVAGPAVLEVALPGEASDTGSLCRAISGGRSSRGLAENPPKRRQHGSGESGRRRRSSTSSNSSGSAGPGPASRASWRRRAARKPSTGALSCASFKGQGPLELSSVWFELQADERPSSPPVLPPTMSTTLFKLQRANTGITCASFTTGERRRALLQFLVAAPSSRFRLAWDLSGILLLVFDLIMVPLQIFAVGDSPGLRAANVATSAFWSADILASFFVGFHSRGLVVMDPRLIAKRYLKSWFILDLLIVALDWTFLMILGADLAPMLRKVSRAMRALRLLRLAKVHTLLSEVNIKTKIKSELTRTLLGILKIIFVILVLNHFIACGFYGLHYADEQKNWVLKNFNAGDSFGYRYWTSVHWSLTQFTPASMEVTPVNAFERCYAVCALLLALICFSSFVSSITSAMTRYGNSNVRRQQQTASLYKFLGQHSISTELVNRVWHYLHDRNVMRTQARTKEEDVELFQLLPESLKVDLRAEMYMPTLTGHALFREYARLEPQAVRHICKSGIKEQSLSFREELFGDCVDVSHMVFVVEGLLSHSYPKCEAVLDTPAKWAQVKVGRGQWACEAALWSTQLSLVGPFVAAQTSVLLLLSVEGLVAAARRFPNSLPLLTGYAEAFLDHARAETACCRWLGAFCNSAEVVQDLTNGALDETMAPASTSTRSLSLNNRRSESSKNWRSLIVPSNNNERVSYSEGEPKPRRSWIQNLVKLSSNPAGNVRQ